MKASPRKKLLGYSMSAYSFIALSSSVKAQIVYTDIDPDTIVETEGDDYTGQYVSLDMNADGINDFSFHLIYKTWNDVFYTTTWNHEASINGGSLNAVAFSIQTGSYATAFGSYDTMTVKTVSRIAEEDTIHAGLQFSPLAYFDKGSCFSTFPYEEEHCWEVGSWMGATEKFAGVRFDIDGDAHYGWVRLKIDNYYVDFYELTMSRITLMDYAYEATPGVPIIAGRITGTLAPATLPAQNVLLSDVNNFGDGRDVQIEFNKAEDEANINAYRVYLTTSTVNPFTLDSALALPSDLYTEIIPTGSDIVFNFDENTKDINGNILTYDSTYNAYVLSYNSATGYPMNISAVSNELVLNMPLSIEETNGNMVMYSAENILYLLIQHESFSSGILTLANLSGEIVLAVNIIQPQNTFQLLLPAGMYFAIFQSEKTLYSQKVVIR